jgi:hypothetical protein
MQEALPLNFTTGCNLRSNVAVRARFRNAEKTYNFVLHVCIGVEMRLAKTINSRD